MKNRLAIFAYGVLGYNVLVILWGAFVRATGSGAGCGSHWPLCNGEVVPRSPSVETLIEFSHRLTSGVALIAVVALVVWAFRARPSGDPTRLGAGLSLFFIVVEALIGAGLVLLEYVAANVSIARAYWMMGHLANTFLLLGALTLTAWWASGGGRLRLRGQGSVGLALLAALVAVIGLGMSGAITALGDTLVLTAGISPDDSAVVARLVELRIFHPLIALSVGVLLLGTSWVVTTRRPSARVKQLTASVLLLYSVQLLCGTLNVWLKAPVWLQLVHLLLTDAIWIALVLMAASALAQPLGQRSAASLRVANESV